MVAKKKDINIIWKDITNYEGFYQISNTGEVKGVDRIIICKNGAKKPVKGRIIKPSLDGKGNYLQVGLNKNGVHKNASIHRLVALEFCDGYMEGLHVNHIDGNKTNNTVENLEWVTRKENNYHKINVLGKGIAETNSMAKLTNKDVEYIYTNPDNLNAKQLMEKFKVKDFCLYGIWNQHRWRSVTKKLKRNKIIKGKRVDVDE